MENLLSRYFKLKGEYILSYGFDTIKKSPNYNKIKNELKNRLLKTNWFKDVRKYCLVQNKLDLKCLLSGNKIELIIFRNDEPIIGEVKSKYGPELKDTRLYFTKRQLKKFDEFITADIKTIIYLVIALDKPGFTSIPFKKFDVPDLKGRRSDRVKVRIPLDHRDLENYTEIPEKLYSFENESSLINELKNEN